jgi:hypothetical protein
MSSHSERTGVLAALRERIVAQMADEGWVTCTQGVDRAVHGTCGGLAELTLSLARDFSAIASFSWEQQHDGALNVSGGIVLRCQPAFNLLQRLAGSEVIGAMPLNAFVETSIASALEAPEVAEQLRAIAADRSALETLADVDRMVGMLRSRQTMPFDGDLADVQDIDPVHWEHASGQLIAALLAGAKRFREARQVLSEHQQCAGIEGWAPREYRRFARQLQRFLDAGGELVLPSSPPSWPPVAEHAPVHGLAKTPKDARAQSSDRSPRKLRGIKDLLASLRVPPRGDDGQRPRDIPEDEYIELEPPDRAAYPILANGPDRVAAQLHPTMRATIDRIAAEVPSAIGMRLVTVWLTRQRRNSPQVPDGLNVHIGSQCVGELDGDVAERLRPALEAAAERDEDPWAYAYLSTCRAAMPYRLEIAMLAV